MKYLRDSDPRFQRLGLKVGGFLGFLCLLLLVMGIVLAWRQDLFEPTDDFFASPQRADGILPGMDVTLHGIRVGRVHDLWIDEKGEPQMSMRVRRKGSIWLRQDAVAVLTGRGPLETPYIDLRAGSPELPPLADGAELKIEREASLGEIAKTLRDDLRPVIATGADLFNELNSPDGDVRTSLSAVRSLTVDLARDVPQTLAEATAATKSTRQFMDGLADENGDVGQARRQLLAMSGEIERRLPALMGDVQKSVGALRRTSEHLETTAKTASPDLQQFLERSKEAAGRTEALLGDIRNIWILRVLLPRQRGGDAGAAGPVNEPGVR